MLLFIVTEFNLTLQMVPNIDIRYQYMQGYHSCVFVQHHGNLAASWQPRAATSLWWLIYLLSKKNQTAIYFLVMFDYILMNDTTFIIQEWLYQYYCNVPLICIDACG